MTLEEGEHRGRGAYYAPLKESIQLRKRRLQVCLSKKIDAFHY